MPRRAAATCTRTPCLVDSDYSDLSDDALEAKIQQLKARLSKRKRNQESSSSSEYSDESSSSSDESSYDDESSSSSSDDDFETSVKRRRRGAALWRKDHLKVASVVKGDPVPSDKNHYVIIDCQDDAADKAYGVLFRVCVTDIHGITTEYVVLESHYNSEQESLLVCDRPLFAVRHPRSKDTTRAADLVFIDYRGVKHSDDDWMLQINTDLDNDQQWMSLRSREPTRRSK